MVLGVVTWLVVVAVGSTAVWLVISRAGQDVGTAREAPVGAAATVADPGPSLIPPSRSERPEPGSASPSRSGTPSTPGSPTTSGSGAAAGGGSSSPAAPESSATTQPPAAPAAERRTWNGPGGLLTAQCRDAAVSLVAAQPEGGYAVEVHERGPEELEVTFEAREDDSGQKSEVRARCEGGAPHFESRTEHAGGDD
jgi:hypothetical protein